MSRLYDTQNIRNILTREVNNILMKFSDNQAIQEEILVLQGMIIKELDATQEVIIIPQNTIQRVEYLLAGYVLCQDERKNWYLNEVIKILRPNPEIESLLKKAYGTNYPILLSRLRRNEKTINEIKFLLDHLETKTINNNDTKNWGYARVLTLLTELPLIQPEIHQIIGIILTNTNLGNTKIHNQTLLTQERQIKKTPLTETDNTQKRTTEESTKTTTGENN